VAARHEPFRSNSVSHLRKVYNHSYVVTRDEVPNLK
jgi:hypothetical protein